MTRGSSSSSSQVGLFSTQISEQIVRLRALAKSQDGPTEAHQVDLRRAVMATRLLAGSARVLRLDPLQLFLDELLAWLQMVQNSGRALNTTQALILDSVVEIEEALMLHLDKVENTQGTDLSEFRPQIDDLLTLIRHNLARTGATSDAGTTGGTSPGARLDLSAIDRSAGFAPVPVEGPETLDALLHWFSSGIERATSEADFAALLTTLEGPLERLIALRAELLQRASHVRTADPGQWTAGRDAIEDPLTDAVFGAAALRLNQQTEALGVTAHVHGFGGAALLAPSVHTALSQVLAHLVDDIVASLRHGRSEEDRAPVRVRLAVVAEEGRARITVADDAPRLHGSPLLGDADQLALFTGLRRARPLLEQIQGLIRVEPSDEPEARFVLSVPLDRDRPRYTVLHLDQAHVAVPAALVDEVIDATGLLYDTDESGESVDHGGSSVPIADLAQFAAVVKPAANASPRIAVLGLVEKRLGLGCAPEIHVVEAEQLLDPPSGWEAIAYASLEVGGETLPVLDIHRLLALRFRTGGEHDLAGAHADPMMDAFDPVEEESALEPVTPPAPVAAPVAPRPPEDARGHRGLQRVLLVNQSEFRRRDLARTLEQLGLDVKVSGDLVAAARLLEQGGIDLLVTDLRLGQEGGESFHSLRAKHPALRILLTSSVAQQYARELADTTGAHRCWLDPYRTSDLRQVLAKLEA